MPEEEIPGTRLQQKLQSEQAGEGDLRRVQHLVPLRLLWLERVEERQEDAVGQDNKHHQEVELAPQDDAPEEPPYAAPGA